jgi:hypothetical protein
MEIFRCDMEGNDLNNLTKSELTPEILAVIAAAMAAIDAGPGIKLKVSSVRRVGQSAPVWNMTGRFERLKRNLNS